MSINVFEHGTVASLLMDIGLTVTLFICGAYLMQWSNWFGLLAGVALGLSLGHLVIDLRIISKRGG